MVLFIALMVMWGLAYIGILCWSLSTARVAVGGLALFLLSLFPMVYGRMTTPSEWHDSPLMGVFVLPTLAAALLGLIVLVAGLFLNALRLLGHNRPPPGEELSEAAE